MSGCQARLATRNELTEYTQIPLNKITKVSGVLALLLLGSIYSCMSNRTKTELFSCLEGRKM